MSPSTVEEVSDCNSALEYVQTGLDVLGLIPGVGAFADLTNALIYSWNGDYVAASISMAAIVVDGAILTKYAGKALEKTSQKVAKVVVEEAAEGAGQSLVQANRTAGNLFRDELAAALRAEGRVAETEVFKRTPFGKRYIDIDVWHNGVNLGGIETKVGGSRYLPLQRLKDAWLGANGYPVNLVRKPIGW
ncbi:MAG TPA: hypothetical protein VLB84_01515 [Bacteroidia bacterium]|nr:hypothetical protein [Bacteroidia bacterium]